MSRLLPIFQTGGSDDPFFRWNSNEITMLYYLLLPILSILLIVLQSTVTDLIFSGRFIFEISLIVVVYAGFRLDLIKEPFWLLFSD